MKAQHRCLALLSLLLWGSPAFSMHIGENLLPASWALVWTMVAIPFVLWGTRQIRIRSLSDPPFKTLVALVGSGVFIISCMPIPVPTAGTCSHPCGTGLAAVLIGPGPTVVVASIALLLQALFLAHGGLTTLGANMLSMGVVGSFTGYGIFLLLTRLRMPWGVAAFFAGAMSDWATYATTAVELSLGLDLPIFPILLAFVPTQLPLGLFEGMLTLGAFRFVRIHGPTLLRVPLAAPQKIQPPRSPRAPRKDIAL